MHTATVSGATPNEVIEDILNGGGSGNFGWLAWTSDQGEPALQASLTPPGNSTSYTNPNNPIDHVVSVGDWVAGRPGSPNSSGIRSALDQLKQIDIIVPVWDQVSGTGAGQRYRVSGFAKIRITDYRLPGQNRISARFISVEDCDGTPPPPPPTNSPLTNAKLTLDPIVSGPNVRGTAITLRATLLNRFGDAVVGQAVSFTRTGANAGTSTATTNTSSVAVLTYTGANNGTDRVQAAATAAGVTVQSPQNSVSWVTPASAISTSTVYGRFFPNPVAADCVFDARPGDTPLFTQTFPSLLSNPPAGTVTGAPAAITTASRPMINVMTDAAGAYAGQIVVQRDAALQAGVAPHSNFEAAFTGAFVVAAAGDITFTIYNDDSFLFGVGGGATRVSGTIMVDALGRRTTYTYDNANRLTRSTFPDGTFTQQTLNFRDQAVTTTDQGGRVSRHSYDLAGQLLSTVMAEGTPDAATVRYGYDLAGRTVTVTDPLNNITTSTYDDAGRATRITNALGQATNFTYYPAGWMQTITDANGKLTLIGYDQRGRLNTIVHPNNTSEIRIYDGAGRVTESADAGGKISRYGYDDAGQLTSVTNPNGETTAYQYDNAGRLTKLTDANLRETTFSYDLLGRRSGRIWPDRTTSDAWTYDLNGNLLSHRVPSGETNSFTYDVMNRPASATYFDGTSTSYTYTATGQRATVVDARGTTTYTYTNRDQVATVNVPGSGTVGYTYDAEGGRISMTAGGQTTSYTYDAARRLATVANASVGTVSYGYDPVGNRTSMTLPNGITTAYSYDDRNRLTSVTHRQGGTPVSSFAYTLDAAGNRQSVTEADGSTVTWTYDNAYRLQSETRRAPGGAVTYQAGFAYDQAGNRTNVVENGASTVTAYNANDQIVSSTSSSGTTAYQYDARGNLTRRTASTDITQYGWDARNRLSSVTLPNATAFSYGYDDDGRRVRQTSGSTVTNYQWDEQSRFGDVLRETDGTGATTASYLLGGDEPMAQTRAGTTSWYLKDGQGSVRALAGSTGTLTDSFTYKAYGDLLTRTGTTATSYGYTGQQTDGGTGLLSLRARYYDLATGRFLSRDTYEPSLTDVGQWGLYGYGRGNPIGHEDPSGALTAEYAALLARTGAAAGAIVILGQAIVDLLALLLAVSSVAPAVQELVGRVEQTIDFEEVSKRIKNLRKKCLPPLTEAWKQTLRRRPVRQPNTVFGQYQTAVTGPEEYFVSGSIPGISIWADGISTINCAFLDAKYSRGSFGPYESDPRALGSFVAQVGKYVELIADPEVPLNKLKILTNSTGAVAVFRALLATLTTKFAIPVEVRLQPARPYMGE